MRGALLSIQCFAYLYNSAHTNPRTYYVPRSQGLIGKFTLAGSLASFKLKGFGFNNLF